jgi:hypothetical protein
MKRPQNNNFTDSTRIIMRKINLLFPLLMALLAVLLFTQPGYSASIKDRMAARIPQINQLKSAGVVGENNKGYLEFRAAKTNEALIAEENQDRGTVYAAIAKREGATSELVGKRRAKMIEEKGSAGQWFQKDDGSWYKK